MKKILLAVSLMFGGATLVVAQDDRTSTQGQTQTQTTQDQDQDKKQQIAVSELPEAVSAKLESQDFSGWTVGNAYKKTDESNREMYIIELKQGTETKKVKFDSDGNEMEKGKHHDKGDNTNYRDAESDQSATDQSTTGELPEGDESATDQSTESDEQSTETEQSTPDHADNSSTKTEQQ